MDNSIQQKSGRARIEVIFEFVCPKPTLAIYRGVRATDGGYRMERRGPLAKRFKPFMWSGGKDSLYQHKQALEYCYRTGVLPFSFLANSEQNLTREGHFMNLIIRIVLGLVKLALVIGVAGGLTDLTLAMKSEAAKANRQGIVSLKQLNQVLIGPKKK